MSHHNASERMVIELFSREYPGSATDRDLAAGYTPIIQFDIREPFLPLAVGYTIFRESGPSPSFPRFIELTQAGAPQARIAIEYAIWWDWEIEHLYELEHVWVYLDKDKDGQVVRAEASWHGSYYNMAVEGRLPLTDNRLTIFSESGKHAFAPTPDWLEARRPITHRSCTRHAGTGGVWVTSLFEELIDVKTPQADRLVHTYLERYAFEPSLEFTQSYQISSEMLVPWTALFDWIPRRVAWWVNELDRTIPPAERRFWRIAHRGASAYAPENTIAAIVKAAELGADLVELDVHSSADGVPVIIHDAELSRTTNGLGMVSWHTLSELKKLDAGNGEPIPTLKEAIACCQEYGLAIYLELKSGFAIPTIVELIRRQNLYHRFVVSSFRPDWLANVKKLDPNIVTSVLFGSVDIDAVTLARAVDAQYVHPAWEKQAPEPHRLLTPEWMANMRAAGLGIICWHEERLSEIAALRRLGIDGICSDAPELLS